MPSCRMLTFPRERKFRYRVFVSERDAGVQSPSDNLRVHNALAGLEPDL